MWKAPGCSGPSLRGTNMRTLSKDELAAVAGGLNINVNIQSRNTQNGNQNASRGGTVNAGSQLFQNTNINAAGTAVDNTNSTTTIVNI
jgi:hypothetical protein